MMPWIAVLFTFGMVVLGNALAGPGGASAAIGISLILIAITWCIREWLS